MRKNPSIKMKTFSSFRSNMFNRHMISDAKNIFIVGCEKNLEDIYVLGMFIMLPIMLQEYFKTVIYRFILISIFFQIDLEKIRNMLL